MQKIAQLGEPILRRKANKITAFKTKKLNNLVAVLHDCLGNSQGVGLAGPQIYQPYCVLIIASKPTARYPNAPLMPPEIFINPSFEICSNNTQKDWEGCLSIPSIRALVSRHQHILVHYNDVNGALQQKALEGFNARIFQHEYDHLQGLVYLDRVDNNQDIISETEFFKLIAQTNPSL
ncbi:MAG: peptide deformylase [Methylococcales bacterium]|nr:peptide deformylase [Methylococcales bacterium]